ncbi:hypothetical protein ABIE21_001278 [Conyzicola nivalis]|uniref:Uncharacterized protein n=1 Tax=Conyzicola nivalis TaxID=1477021 RepID=A0ABV2QMP8_9MICO
MAAAVFVTLVAAGCLGLAVASLVALSALRSRRVDVDRGGRDLELATAMSDVQADIEKGQRGY